MGVELTEVNFNKKPLKWPTKSKPSELLLSEKSPKTHSPPNSPNSDKSLPPSKSPRSPLSLPPNSVRSTSSKRHRQGFDRYQPNPKSRTPKALPRKEHQAS